MTSAATGKARSIGLREVFKAATYTLELVAIATAYFGLAVSGLLIPWINPTATPLWPPTGLALALMLIRGYRIWPAILVGAFFSTVVGGGGLSEAGCIALGTPIAALAGAWLINRWSHGRETFATPLGVAKFALIAFAPTAMISATMAIVGLVLANDVGLASPVAKWTARWLADASGTLLIAPVIVLWATKPSRAWSRWSLLETAGVVIVTAAIAIAAFSPQVGSTLMDSDFYALLPYRSLLAVLVVLPLLWASLRGSPRDAAAAAPVFYAIAAWGFATSFDLNG
jgi:integral membrane sensor domain MASE1